MQEKGLYMLIHLFQKQKCSNVEKTTKNAKFTVIWGIGETDS